ncbi:MAG: DUF6468 domain-containing protein [Alphaproteobacteria bacterium]|nr:DUF6468 domain-containing protein [Alphaproteobacteria bacterium]
MIQTFLLDSIMILLLLCAIGFCWRLNIRLNSLKKISSAVAPAIKGFNDIVERVTHGIEQLKQQNQQTRELLSNQVPKAQNLKQDLELLLDYAESATDRLEKMIQEMRQTEHDVKNTFSLIHKTLPKNFHQTLQNSEIELDFDELKKLKMTEVISQEEPIGYPHKIKENENKLNIDEKLTKSLKNLR